MLQLEKLTWSAPEGGQVLNGVDLVIPDNKLVVITGPNGGGKTTLAKLIAGLEKPDSGRIILDGRDITGLDITERARLGVSYAFQQPVRFKGLTVTDLLELASGKKLSHSEACDYLARVGLCANEYVNREVNATLSGGEIKRIEIASVLARAGVAAATPAHSLTKEGRRKLVHALRHFSLRPTALRPVEEAIVTAGGVDVRELDPKTMQSKKVAGLYFAGEVIDADALTGGYNLQTAFTTGYIAGKSASF